MILKLIILTIFINLFGCAKAEIPVIIGHPDLITPEQPDVPKFTREMINCGRDEAVLDLCIRIKEREAVLEDHINTLEYLINLHNVLLEMEPESGQ